MIDFFRASAGFRARFEVDFVIVLRAQNDRAVRRDFELIMMIGACIARDIENQIQQNEWIRVEPAVQEQGRVQNDPKYKDGRRRG